MNFVRFEDVLGKEIYVNPNLVKFIKEFTTTKTIVNFGEDETIQIKATPQQVMIALNPALR